MDYKIIDQEQLDIMIEEARISLQQKHLEANDGHDITRLEEHAALIPVILGYASSLGKNKESYKELEDYYNHHVKSVYSNLTDDDITNLFSIFFKDA